MMFDNKKTRFAQCFLHKYRNKRYNFVIIYVLQKCFIKYLQSLQDSVFDLLVYKYIFNQRIYSLLSILSRTIYFIDVPEELN